MASSNSTTSHQKVTAYLEHIVGNNCGKKIPLYEQNVVIGRSKSADICIDDPNISRNHCSLKYTLNGWLIKDLGSVNGTYVDDVAMLVSRYQPLTDKCAIYFGPKEDAPAGLRFEKVKHSKETADKETSKKLSPNRISSPQRASGSRAMKRKASPVDAAKSQKTDLKYVPLDEIGFSPPHDLNIRNAEDGYHSDSSISSLDSLKTRIRKANSSQKKVKRLSSLKFLPNVPEDNLIPRTPTKRKLFEIQPSIERMFLQSNDTAQEDSLSLLNDNIFMEWNVDYNSYKKHCMKKVSPSREFNCSPDDLNASSVAVHSNLLQVLQKKVNDLQDTLKTLNLKFSNTMNENARLVELVKSKETAEINMKEDFKRLLDEELICNICTELYIKPITLGCSHTFCQHCIYEWKKKKRQCPMCRERIESETTVLFMDNFINKAVEQLDKASLEKRFELMKKREEIQKKKPKRKKSKSRNSRRTPAVHPTVSVTNERDDEVELLRSRISEIQSYTDDIQNYVDVIDELISERISDEDNSNYVGYGRCFNCGRIGHWAEDCPY